MSLSGSYLDAFLSRLLARQLPSEQHGQSPQGRRDRTGRLQHGYASHSFACLATVNSTRSVSHAPHHPFVSLSSSSSSPLPHSSSISTIHRTKHMLYRHNHRILTSSAPSTSPVTPLSSNHRNVRINACPLLRFLHPPSSGSLSRIGPTHNFGRPGKQRIWRPFDQTLTLHPSSSLQNPSFIISTERSRHQT